MVARARCIGRTGLILAAGLGLTFSSAAAALTLEGISLQVNSTSSSGTGGYGFDGTGLFGSTTSDDDIDPLDGTVLLREGDLQLTAEDLEHGGSGFTYYGPSGDWKLTDWELDVVSDPLLIAVVGVANLSSVAQTFDIVLDVPVVAVAPASLLDGSVATVLDFVVGLGSISDDGSNPLYVGRLDGNAIAGTVLVPAPFSSSTNVPSGSFSGVVGPPVAGTIGIRLRFELDAFTATLFSSRLNVVAVPEPRTVALLALGLVAAAVARRRSR